MRVVVQRFCCHATPTTHSLGAFYASALGRVLGERLLTPAANVLNLFSWVETIGEAFSLGWRVTVAARTVGKTARIQSRAVNARTARSWTWRRWVCTRGREFPLSRLESRLRCPRCGGRNLVVLYAPTSAIAVRRQ